MLRQVLRVQINKAFFTLDQIVNCKRKSYSWLMQRACAPYRFLAAVFSVLMLIALGSPALAQSTNANSVTASGPAPSFFFNPIVTSCVSTVATISNGTTANPGICLLDPVDPGYTLTLAFSPADTQRMTGLNLWSNAGGAVNDRELVAFDLEVDHFNPATGATETLTLNNVNIGDTTSLVTPTFAAFPSQLFRVTQVRMSNMRGDLATATTSGMVVFREVQGVFTTVPTAPEIGVSSSEGGSISDGGTDAHSSAAFGTPRTVTYTINNSGTGTLTLPSSPTVGNLSNITGTPVVGALSASSLAPGASATFTVTYTPAAAGPFGFDIVVPNDDADENPYDITVSGSTLAQPTVVLTGPTQAQSGPFTVTATFSEPVSGLTLAGFTLGNGTVSNLVMVSPGVYTILVTPLKSGESVTIAVSAGAAKDANGSMNAASNLLTIAGLALSDPEREEIKEVIIEQEVRTLRTHIDASQRAVRSARERYIQDAKDRFVADQRCSALEEDDVGQTLDTEFDIECRRDIVARGDTPLGFSGTLLATQDSAQANGSFFGQRSSFDGSRRRLIFGSFDVSRYSGGDVAATFNGRIAWERALSNDALLGYFISANASQTSVKGNFSGTHRGYGLSTGAYYIDEIRENLFWDGFVAFGVGRNNLDLSNGVKDVDGDYDARSIQLGLALSGRKEYKSFDLRPELSIAYGYSQIGAVDLNVNTANASLKDTIAAGNVGLGTISFTPQIIFPLVAAGRVFDAGEFSIAPSVACEQLKTTTSKTQCGGGLELEWSASSDDGLRQFSARISRDVMGPSMRDSLGLEFRSEF